MSETKVIENLVSFHDDVGGGLVIKQQQYIPDQFVTDCRNERADSLSTRAVTFHRVASIPTAFVDKWKALGFDINVEPVSAILARLRKEELDGFITSNKVF